MKIVVVIVQRFASRQEKTLNKFLKKHFSSTRKHFSFINGRTGLKTDFICYVNALFLCSDVESTPRTCFVEPGIDVTFFLGKRQSGGKRTMLMQKK